MHKFNNSNMRVLWRAAFIFLGFTVKRVYLISLFCPYTRAIVFFSINYIARNIHAGTTGRSSYVNPYAAGCEFRQSKIIQNTWKEYFTIQWIPTWQGLDGIQKSLHPYLLGESNYMFTVKMNYTHLSFGQT